MKKRPNQALEPRHRLSRSVLTHGSRQPAAWLIFDVSPGMTRSDLKHGTWTMFARRSKQQDIWSCTVRKCWVSDSRFLGGRFDLEGGKRLLVAGDDLRQVLERCTKRLAEFPFMALKIDVYKRTINSVPVEMTFED